MKKNLALLLCLLLAAPAVFCQTQHNNDDTNGFQKGAVVKLDSSVMTGWLKFYKSQASKLKFKQQENSELEKFAPDEILGFQIGDEKFVSLKDIEVHEALGVKTKEKKCFGQVLETGEINLYLIPYIGHNAITQTSAYYLNLVLRKKTGEQVSVPYTQRIKKGKVEKVKAELAEFFKDNAALVAEINKIGREGEFREIPDIVKRYNGEDERK
jgi:hypothetical protein